MWYRRRPHLGNVVDSGALPQVRLEALPDARAVHVPAPERLALFSTPPEREAQGQQKANFATGMPQPRVQARTQLTSGTTARSHGDVRKPSCRTALKCKAQAATNSTSWQHCCFASSTHAACGSHVLLPVLRRTQLLVARATTACTSRLLRRTRDVAETAVVAPGSHQHDMY